ALGSLGRSRAWPVIHAVSRDGRLLATTDGRTHTLGVPCPIHLWETATGKHLHLLSGHPTAVYGAAFSPDGKVLLSGGYDNLRAWDVATGKQLGRPVPHTGQVYAVAFAPDGKTFATGSEEVRLFETATRKQLRRLDKPPARPAL